jgi:hypothetical protein
MTPFIGAMLVAGAHAGAGLESGRKEEPLSLGRRDALRVDGEHEEEDGEGPDEGCDQTHCRLVLMSTKVRPPDESQVTKT